MTGRSGQWGGLVASALALLAIAPSARGERGSERTFDVDQTETTLVVTTSFADLFDARARSQLDSGFWNLVTLRLSVIPEGSDQPVAVAARTCRIRYELWEEYYEVQVSDRSGTSTVRAPDRSTAIATCAVLEDFPVARLDALGSGRFSVLLLAELNPVSEELLDSIRRWLASPQGGGRRFGRDESFFGSAVSIFVNSRIGQADRTIQFRSQVFSP